MLLKDDKKKTVSLILRRIKGNSETYDDLKASNESLSHAQVKNGAEQSYESGKSNSVDDIMEAIASKDKQRLKSALSSFMEMKISESEKDEDETPED